MYAGRLSTAVLCNFMTENKKSRKTADESSVKYFFVKSEDNREADPFVFLAVNADCPVMCISD